MQAELREEVEHVDGVEEERRRPVDGNGEHQRQPQVGDPWEQIRLGLQRVGRQRRKRRIVEAVVGHDGSLGGEVVHDVSSAVDHAKRADEAALLGRARRSKKKSVEMQTRGRGEFGIKRLIKLGVGRMSRTECVQGFGGDTSVGT